MREIRLYEGSDSGSKGSRCGNYGLNETDLEGRKGIYHNFGQFGPFGQQPNKGLCPLEWGEILYVCLYICLFYPLASSCLV